MGTISSSQLGTVVIEHHDSLVVDIRRTGLRRHLPWIIIFILGPIAAAVVLFNVGYTTDDATAGLLAGVGVLGGLLFQVLAWISGRIASLADRMGDRAATAYELALIRRLDIARANIAYSSLASVIFVVGLGLAAMMNSTPTALKVAFAALLLHLGANLVLVVLRISAIGKDDRVAALTAHARRP